MLRYLLVCLALLGIAPDVNAQSAPPAAHQPANAMQLSRLLNPDDKILAASDSAFRTGFEAALTKDPATAAMFKEHPALLDAIYDGALPVVRRQVKDSMPTLHQKCTRFFAERFTPAEIDQLIAFYGSPTGSKLVTGMYAGLDMSKIVEAIGPEGKDPVTGDAMKGAIASTIVGVLPSFNEADWKALIEFAKSPLFFKVKAATPDMLKLSTEIANEPDPKFDAELEQVITRIVEDYFAKVDRAAAGS